MKRFYSVVLICLLIFLTVAPTYAVDPFYSTINLLEPKLKSSPIYILGPYDENSNEGYSQISDPDTGTYYLRVREIKLIHGPADNDPVTNYKNFGIVYRTDNFSGTLSESVSISDSVQKSTTVSDSIAVKLGFETGTPLTKVKTEISTTHTEAVTNSVGHTVTKNFSQGYSYGFPAANAPANCTKAKRGVGFQYETYRSIIDIKKEVNVEKYVDIVSKRYINECSICNNEDPQGRPTPAHRHDGFVGYRFTLADGTVEDVDEYIIDFLIDSGKLTSDMSKWKKTVKEWRREEAVGEVKVPVDVMATVYYDSAGNILDENGNIINP